MEFEICVAFLWLTTIGHVSGDGEDMKDSTSISLSTCTFLNSSRHVILHASEAEPLLLKAEARALCHFLGHDTQKALNETFCTFTER